MQDFDALRFDIELAIKLDSGIPRSKRERSDWAEYVAGKIAARLRRNWEFVHKPANEVPAAKWPYCRQEPKRR